LHHTELAHDAINWCRRWRGFKPSDCARIGSDPAPRIPQ
jgi:hypothetical protein